MTRKLLFSLLALLVLAAVLIVAFSWFSVPEGTPGTETPMVCEDDSVSSPSALHGIVVEDLALLSLARTPVMLHELAGQRFTVLVFCSYLCPCSDGYIDRLKTLRTQYEGRGVAFAAIHSSANENIDGMQRYITRRKYPLPVYRDEHGAAADALGAAVTPEVFVFDAAWKLRYHGQIDDEKLGAHMTHPSLSLALDTLLDGRPLLVSERPAPGCAIVRQNESDV
ncbi:MAG: redoxin domain-containing protein [Bacteroidia bacterium]|nr:redoxin domain-containing protein [Bacteroidia bacterium]